ncbi:hypothetical protein DEM25_010050 [Oceaniradius stylonematis]|uniref:Mobilization protein n=1 Tax=Oceaniradius stylonematis TaxID=2184161 RepID=A0A3A8AAR0_9HYPH|nr:hypothetical protein [Oceaniradius stylonematis]RKF06965.1 hypothetical protein DEM25_010050 [Oceaniradius stylonematis]
MSGSEANATAAAAKSEFRSVVGNGRKKSAPRITLRLSEEELNRLQHAAAGMTLSAYMRERLFGKTATLRKVRNPSPVKDQQALARVLGLLGQSEMATSLRTLAYEARCGAILLDDVTYAKIDAACAHVANMRHHLIAALGLIEQSNQ